MSMIVSFQLAPNRWLCRAEKCVHLLDANIHLVHQGRQKEEPLAFLQRLGIV